MSTIFGLPYFRDFAAALAYYKQVGYEYHAVVAKLKDGEIKIGRPMRVERGDRLTVDADGRYVLETDFFDR